VDVKDLCRLSASSAVRYFVFLLSRRLGTSRASRHVRVFPSGSVYRVGSFMAVEGNDVRSERAMSAAAPPRASDQASFPMTHGDVSYLPSFPCCRAGVHVLVSKADRYACCLWTLFIWMSGVWQAWTLTGLFPALIAREGLLRTSEQGSNLNPCKIEAQLLLQLSDTMHTNIAVASRGTKTLRNKCSLCYSMI
jgi:hypothetical protein